MLHQTQSGLRTGGAFFILAAFAAWYVAFAGMLRDTNSYFKLPICPLP